MSYFQQAIEACPNIQERLDEAWRVGLGPGADERMPVAEFLTSDANRRGVTMSIAPGRGKVRTASLVYRPRQVEANILEDQDNPNCAASDYYGELSKDYTIDTTMNLQSQISIAVDQYDDGCWPNSDYFARDLMFVIDGLDRKVASDITDQAAVLAGDWAPLVPTGGVGDLWTVNASKEFQLQTVTSAGVPNVYAWAKLRNALEDSAMGGQVLVSGGSTFRDYFQVSQVGCCTDSGVDLGQMFGQFGYAFAYDYRLQRALGSINKGMVFVPGALQVVNWTRAGWKDGAPQVLSQGANYFHTAIASPRLGLVYDLTIKDDCGTLSIAATATNKVIALPDDMYASSDPYEGITGVTKIIAVNP